MIIALASGHGDFVMDDPQRLDFELGPPLEAAGGILDKLDYSRLRRLGMLLRNIPHIHEDQDWDFPPASLQGWIASYSATVEAVQMATRSGMIPIIGPKSDKIRALLLPAIIPSLDAYIVPREGSEEMIALAKEYRGFENFDFEKFSSNAGSREEIARAVVVMLDESVPYRDCPKVDEKVGFKRLQIGALIGKAATGGALAVANFSLGVLAGLSVLPTLVGSVPIAVGIIGSAYTGLAAACDAVEKIGAVVRG
jgi:hypothetical protein